MSDIFEFDDNTHIQRLAGTLHDPLATPGDVLTVQGDGSIAAAAGGGGGGVQVATQVVGSAAVLDLKNTPVVVVPGTLARVTVVVGVCLNYIFGSVPYTDHGGNIRVATSLASNPSDISSASAYSLAGAGFWDQATSQSEPQGYGITQASFALTDLSGQDVVIGQDTANPTLGDGALLVTVAYFLAQA